MTYYEKEKYLPWRVLSQLPIEQVDDNVKECLAAATYFSSKILGYVSPYRGCMIHIYQSEAELQRACVAMRASPPDDTLLGLWSPFVGVHASTKGWVLTHELIHEVLQIDFPESPWVLNEGIPRHFESLQRRCDGPWHVPWTENIVDSFRSMRNAFNDGLKIYDFLDMADWKDEKWIEKKYFEPTFPGCPLIEGRVLFGFFGYLIRFLDSVGILKPYYWAVKRAYYALPPDFEWMILDQVYPILKMVAKRNGIRDIEDCFRVWADRDWAEFVDYGMPLVAKC